MKIKHLKLPPAPVDILKNRYKEKLDFYIKKQGPVDLYSAAKTCNRCGACLQKCPSFKALKSELYSPRGRSQLVNFIFERKLNLKQDSKDISNTMSTCLMCGNCTNFCPAKTPTADISMQISSLLYSAKKKRATILKKHLCEPFIKAKIKRASKKQSSCEKDILFLPSFYSHLNIKNTLAELNTAGLKAILDFNFMAAEYYYFSADIKKLKKLLFKINLQAKKYNALVTDSLEAFAILKKAEIFSPAFKDLQNKTQFISQIIKPRQLKTELKGKKVILYQNNITLGNAKIKQEIEKLLVCPKKHFLIECIQSTELTPAAAMAWLKIKGAEVIRQSNLILLSQIKADYLITASYYDKEFFEAVIKKAGSGLKVLHISQIPEYFYAEERKTSSD